MSSTGYLGCDEIVPLLPAFALGALDSPERDEVERHLRTCIRCRLKLEESSRIVDDLAFAAPDREPSRSLRNAVLGSLEPQTRLFHVPDWRWAAAIAAVLIVLLTGNAGLMLRDRTTNSTQSLNRTTSVASASQSLVWFDLTASNRTGNPPYGILCAQQSGNLAWLMVEDLPALPEGKTYQAWLTDGDQRVSAGTFTVDGEGRGFLTLRLSHSISNYTALGITEEPTGGSQVPTGIRLLGTNL